MRLRSDGRARRLLRRLPSVYSAAELLLIAAVAVQGARLVWAAATPAGPLGDWRPAGAGAGGGGAAYDVLTGFDPFGRLGGAGPATVTGLRLTLFGTRLDATGAGGSAIIAGPDGVQQSVGVGGEVVPGVRLRAVAFDHVTLDRGGAAEQLFLDQSGAVTPVAPAAPGSPAATPSADAGARLRAEIGFVPRLEGGRISGLIVHPQGTGALFARAGLRDGDVVTAVAGRPVTGAADLERVASEQTGQNTLPVVVERGTATLPLAVPLGAGK